MTIATCDRCGDVAETHTIDVGPTLARYCSECILDAMTATEEGDICRVCGCSDAYGCPEGCEWVAESLCSVCAARLAQVRAWAESLPESQGRSLTLALLTLLEPPAGAGEWHLETITTPQEALHHDPTTAAR